MVWMGVIPFVRGFLVEKLTGTGYIICLLGNMRNCLKNRKDAVAFVGDINQISKESWQLTTTIKPAKLGGFYAPNAIQILGYGRLGVLYIKTKFNNI